MLPRQIRLEQLPRGLHNQVLRVVAAHPLQGQLPMTDRQWVGDVLLRAIVVGLAYIDADPRLLLVQVPDPADRDQGMPVPDVGWG